MTVPCLPVPDEVSAVLEVNLAAIRFNYRAIQSLVKPGTQVAGIVKANAYGLGAPEVVTALRKEGCPWFFTAYVGEAITLRETTYPEGPLFVFNGLFPGTEPLYLQHHLTPCLMSWDQLVRWKTYAQERGLHLPCALHMDTGFGREGLSPDEMATLMASYEDYAPYLDIKVFMSHLANSNDANDPKNVHQRHIFLKAYETWPTPDKSLKALGIPASLANSSGLVLGQDYQFDYVRPGLAIYGYKSSFGDYIPLKPSLKAFARVLLTRDVPKGETIGYQGIFLCERDTRLALLSVGHSDGILRSASNVGEVKIHGRLARIAGRVSMDMIMVDITDHPPGQVQPGDWAVLYDDDASIRAFATAEQTSIYELLVRHGNRYHRLYHED